MKKIIAAFAAVILSTGLAFGAGMADLADDTSKKDTAPINEEKDVSFSIHGYVQGNFVVVRNDDKKLSNKWNTSKYEFQRVGGTVQLELEGNAYKAAHFFTALRVEYNAAGEKSNFRPLRVNDGVFMLQKWFFDNYARFNRNELTKYPTVDLRAAYVDLYSKHVTFRAGQQMISWGEIEGIETPTDIICPWDYTTMSNVFEDSRLPVTAANMEIFFAKQKLQFIWIPIFQPAKIPLDRMYLKGASRITRPRFEVRNSEYAARLSGDLGDKFKYGLGFLYGFDDMADSEIRVVGAAQNFYGFDIVIPSYVDTELVYHRVMTPTLDMNIQVGETLSWKVSGNLMIRKDWRGTVDGYRNSTADYLTGIESSNIFGKIYLGLYAGQHWVLNYTPVVEYSDIIGLITRLNSYRQPNVDMLEGYGQLYPYQWVLSSNIQRFFLANDALEFQVRFAVYIEPKFIRADYIISPYISYKFTNGVNIMLGAAIADRLNEDKNMGMLEIRYTF